MGCVSNIVESGAQSFPLDCAKLARGEVEPQEFLFFGIHEVSEGVNVNGSRSAGQVVQAAHSRSLAARRLQQQQQQNQRYRNQANRENHRSRSGRSLTFRRSRWARINLVFSGETAF